MKYFPNNVHSLPILRGDRPGQGTDLPGGSWQWPQGHCLQYSLGQQQHLGMKDTPKT